MVSPPPTAAPRSAAITGLFIVKIRWEQRPAGSCQPSGASPPKSRPPVDRSAPTQKSPPRPVSTTTRTFSSRSAVSKAWFSSSAIRTVYPLRAWGRSSVTVAIRPSTR